MKKERYEKAEIELIRFSSIDVITTTTSEEDELPQGGVIKLI